MSGAVMFLPHIDMTASLSPSNTSGFTTDASPALSGLVTATAQDATGSVSYAWSQTGGDFMTIQNPTSQATRFTQSVPGSGQSIVGTFICTITDAAGQVAASNPVTVTLSWV